MCNILHFAPSMQEVMKTECIGTCRHMRCKNAKWCKILHFAPCMIGEMKSEFLISCTFLQILHVYKYAGSYNLHLADSELTRKKGLIHA